MKRALWHKLSNIDKVNRTAVCSVCGPYKLNEPRVPAGENAKWVCPKRRSASEKKYPARQKEYLRLYRYKRYGITKEIAEETLKKQGGLCAICGGPPLPRGKVTPHLQIDHDHTTGQFRGFVCFNCNIGLGAFKENPQTLEAAIKYLRSAEITMPPTRTS